MGSQGSINVQAPQHAGIDGILKGLDAVSKYYGINTEKQQQKLMETQLPAAKAKAEADTAMEKSRLGWYQDASGESPPQQTTATASQSSNTSGPTGGTDTPVGTSVLGDAVRTQTGRGKIVPPEILAMQKTQQELHNLQTTGAKGDLELGSLPGELKAKANAPIIAAATDFNKLAQPEIDGLKFANQGRKLLAQGGPITGRAAFDAAVKAGADINRVSVETGQDLSKPIGAIAKIVDSFKEGRDQNLTPEKRAQFSQLINIYDQVNRATLGQKAFSVAQIHAPGAGVAIPDLQNKLLSIATSPTMTKNSNTQSIAGESDSPIGSHVRKALGKSPETEEMVPVIGPGGIAGKLPKSKLEAAINSKKFKLMGTDNAKTAANP